MNSVNTTKSVTITHLNNNVSESQSDLIVIEEPINLIINGETHITLLATPFDLEALAFGALFSFRIIENANDVISINIANSSQENIVIRLEVKNKTLPLNLKDFVTLSSKGAGSILLNTLKNQITPIPKTFSVNGKFLPKIIEKLKSLQKIFPLTGGTHAALIFDKNGKIIAFAEDIGRHNALDKAIGKCILNSQPTSGLGVALSSRLSFEMVTKAALAKLELIVAVSAPTSLAVSVAKMCNITLCGFVRGNQTNIYTHNERILNENRFSEGQHK